MANAETAAEMLDAQLEDFEPEFLGEEPLKLVGSGGNVEAETNTERIQDLRKRRELYVECISWTRGIPVGRGWESVTPSEYELLQ